MPRTEGSRNQSYDDRRRALLSKVRDRLSMPGGSRASLRELADAGGVSLPTLKHYFPTRAGMVLALMEEDLSEGAPHLAYVAKPSGPLGASIRAMLGYIAFGFDHGVGQIHTVGLTEGLRDAVLGPGYVEMVLEPSINAVRERLDAHVGRREMRDTDTRHAAIGLLSPVVVLMLHQRELGGSEIHPVDLERFLDDLADGFVRGHVQ